MASDKSRKRARDDKMILHLITPNPLPAFVLTYGSRKSPPSPPPPPPRKLPLEKPP